MPPSTKKRRPPAKTWKHKERHLAALFGTIRRPLSGGNGSHGTERDDAEHERVYLESKYSQRHALFSLWRHCRLNAAREAHRKPKRRVVVGLFEKGLSDALLLVHQDDLIAIAIELLAVKLKDRNQPYNTAHVQDLFARLRTLADTI
jgi:hypothetical protein